MKQQVAREIRTAHSRNANFLPNVGPGPAGADRRVELEGAAGNSRGPREGTGLLNQ